MTVTVPDRGLLRCTGLWFITLYRAVVNNGFMTGCGIGFCTRLWYRVLSPAVVNNGLSPAVVQCLVPVVLQCLVPVVVQCLVPVSGCVIGQWLCHRSVVVSSVSGYLFCQFCYSSLTDDTTTDR